MSACKYRYAVDCFIKKAIFFVLPGTHWFCSAADTEVVIAAKPTSASRARQNFIGRANQPSGKRNVHGLNMPLLGEEAGHRSGAERGVAEGRHGHAHGVGGCHPDVVHVSGPV